MKSYLKVFYKSSGRVVHNEAAALLNKRLPYFTVLFLDINIRTES